MTEILTESFCERCGTRYTFEPVDRRRKKPLSAIGTLGRGIRHFVSDPGTSLDEAFAVARSEQEQRSTASALEAFHRTFNFCLSCRQYTCGDCWNAVEGRCLSCAPTADASPPETRLDTAVPIPPMDLAQAPAPLHPHGDWIGAEAGSATAASEAVAQSEADAAAARAAEEEAAALVAAAAAEAAAAEAAAAEAAAEAERVAAAAAEAAAAEAAAEAERVAAAAAEAAEALAEAAALAENEARIAAEAAAAQADADVRAAAEAQAAAELAAAVQAEADARAAAEAAAEEAARANAEAEARAAAEAEAAAVAAAMAAAEAALAAMAEAEARAAAEADARAADEAAAHAAAEAEAAAAATEAAAHAEEQARLALAFEPGLSLDDKIAAYEAEHAGTADAPEPEGEDIDAASAPAPAEPVAAASEPIPTAIGQPLPASVVEGPISWPEPGAAGAAFEPHWPDIPVPARGPGAGLPSVAPPAVPVAARPCPSCGLSLSASARFCRRCGTQQQVDAPR